MWRCWNGIVVIGALLMACGGPATKTLSGEEELPPVVESRKAPSDTVRVHVENGYLLLADGSRLNTGLFDVRVVYRFIRRGRHERLLVQGRPCRNCASPLGLYLIDPEKPIPSYAGGAGSLHMPGELVDGRTQEAYYAAQVYAGGVLAGRNGVIWYERIRAVTGDWDSSTTFIEVFPDTLIKEVRFDHVALPQTQRAAFRGQCTIVPGLRQEMPV